MSARVPTRRDGRAGTPRAPGAGVPTLRPLPIAALAGVLLGALAAAPSAARAQFAGVLPPPPSPTQRAAIAAADSAAKRGLPPVDTASVRQRLDIQAWVDSAAPALARTPQTARPVPSPIPGSGTAAPQPGTIPAPAPPPPARPAPSTAPAAPATPAGRPL